MKTVNFKVGLMTAALIATAAFVSCSSDDDESSNGGGGATSKRIVRANDATIDYDSQGRIVMITGNDYVTTYTYGENTIIRKTQDDWGEKTNTYTLSNGLITKSVYKGSNTITTTYTYDSNGYMASQIEDIEDKYAPYTNKLALTWTDGNLTKLSEVQQHGDGYSFRTTVTISYSDILWPQNFVMFWDKTGLEIDAALEPLGVWGKMPKNLLNKIVSVYDYYGDTFERTIDYTVENGEITKIIEQRSDGDTEILTLEWK